MTHARAAAQATRKFEALEGGIAQRLAAVCRAEGGKETANNKQGGENLEGKKPAGTFGRAAVRGLKIGAAGVAAGTLFAFTGGMAAPAIVGGVAALTGVGSAVSAVAMVLLLPAATTIFGVGGGTLVANKMSKRTAGLEDFDLVKIQTDRNSSDRSQDKRGNNEDNYCPDLSRTVFVGGWLRDEHDGERPFGVTPRGLTDRHELLCRYCSVYSPHLLTDCRRILEEWRGRERELWDLCRASYGRDPSALLPLKAGPRYDAQLTESENVALDELTGALGLTLPEPNREQGSPQEDQELEVTCPPAVNFLSDLLSSSKCDENQTSDNISNIMLRSYQAWDFHAEYGSEQYIILWEKDLLLKMNGSAKKMQRDFAEKAAGEVLKKTAVASLMAAVFLPSTLLSLSNMVSC